MVDRTADGELSAMMVARVSDVGGMAPMGDVLMDTIMNQLAGRPRDRRAGSGFDGALPDAIRSRRFDMTYGGDSRRWSAAWGYTSAEGGARLDEPGWWVAWMGPGPTAASVKAVDRLRWMVRQPVEGEVSSGPAGVVRPADLLEAVRLLGPGWLDGRASYASVMSLVEQVSWAVAPGSIEGVAWVAMGEARLSAPAP